MRPKLSCKPGRAVQASIGRYLIQGELGRGAMGIVYDAIDPIIGRKVALKVISLQAAAQVERSGIAPDLLFRDARSAGQLFHPGIVVILDVGQQGDSAFIAMERVDGPSLQEVLSAGRVSPERSLDILRQIAEALDYAHQHGIVHRDIKPANIMLHQQHAVKVTDFGIAKIMSSTHATQPGFVIGTPSYMSPEQVESQAIDGKADQFALAVLAYEMLTGVKPFKAESIATLAYLIVFGPRPSPQSRNPALPSALDPVFERGLAKRASDRFETCAAFVSALAGALAANASPDKRSENDKRSEKPGWKRRGFLFAAGLALVFSSLLATVFHYKRSQVPDLSPARREIASPSLPTPQAAPFPPRILQLPAAVSQTVSRPKPIPVSLRASQLYTSALAKRQEGKSAEAAALFQQAADLGGTAAMVELGESFRSGEGVEQDAGKAMHWFRRAADAGNSSAMVFLGAMYLLGEGGDPNEAEAARWYQKAVDRGNAAGYYDLGTLYETGQGVSKNLEKAGQLYEHAAELGNREAEKKLRHMAEVNKANRARSK